MLELDDRFRSLAPIMALAFGSTVAAATVMAGPWALVALGAVAALAINQALMHRVQRPEYLLALGALLGEAGIAVAAARTGGFTSPLALLLTLPALVGPVRFSRRAGFVMLAAMALVIIVIEVLLAPGTLVDMAARAVAFGATLLGVGSAASILARSELNHRKASLVDSLTQLANRGAFEAQLASLEHLASDADGSVSLLLIDIDHFKAINDEYGHHAGDQVLRHVSQAMQDCLRESELLYRAGGEEFAVILPKATARDGVHVAERIRQTVDQLAPSGLQVTVSVGVAARESSAIVTEDLFLAADCALYAAKESGRNRVCVSSGSTFPPSLDGSSRTASALTRAGSALGWVGASSTDHRVQTSSRYLS